MLSIDIHYCFSKVLPEYCTQISKPTFRLPLKVAVGYHSLKNNSGRYMYLI